MDQNKELSDATIREQISDFSDLVVTMDLAPPTQPLMFWMENGGARRLLARPCSGVVAPQVVEVKRTLPRPLSGRRRVYSPCFSAKLFSKCGKPGARGEVEKMRQDRREGRNRSLEGLGEM